MAKALENPFEKTEDKAEQEDEAQSRVKARDDEVEVSLDEKKDEDDEEGEAEEVESRAEKKRRRAERHRELREARDAAEQRAKDLEARISQIQQQQSQMQGWLQAQQAPQGDPYQAELDRVWEEQQRLASEFETMVSKGALTDDLKKQYWQRHRQLDEYKSRVSYERAQANDPRNSPQYQHNQEIIRWLNRQHADVVNHHQRDAIIYAAQGEYMRMVAKGAPKDNFETYEKAMAATKRDWGLTKRPAPTDNQRERFAGVPRGGGSGEAPRTVALSKAEQKMAVARYRGIAKDETEAYRMWAKDIAAQRAKKSASG